MPRAEEQEQPEHELFGIAIHDQGHNGAWIALSGALDGASAAGLARSLEPVLDDSALIVIDLRGLTFLDSGGAEALVTVQARARREGQRLVIIRGPWQIERTLALAGLATVLEIADLGPDGLHVATPPPAPD